MGKPDLLRPTLISGIIFGVVAGLPFLGCCCCLWMAAAGWLATFLYIRESKRRAYPFKVSDGAVTGLLAGLFGGFSSWTVETVGNILFGQRLQEAMLSALDRVLQGVPPEAGQALEALRKGLEEEPTVPTLIVGLMVTMFLFALLSTVAGVLTGAMLARSYGPPVVPAAGLRGGWPPGTSPGPPAWPGQEAAPRPPEQSPTGPGEVSGKRGEPDEWSSDGDGGDSPFKPQE
jgi:hypothetical protein